MSESFCSLRGSVSIVGTGNVISNGSRANQVMGYCNWPTGIDVFVYVYQNIQLPNNDVMCRLTTRPKVLGVYWDQHELCYNLQITTNTVVVEFGPYRQTEKVK